MILNVCKIGIKTNVQCFSIFIFTNIYIPIYHQTFFKKTPVLRMLNCLPQLFKRKAQTTNTGKSMVPNSTHSNLN